MRALFRLASRSIVSESRASGRSSSGCSSRTERSCWEPEWADAPEWICCSVSDGPLTTSLSFLRQPPKKGYVNYKVLQQQIKEKKQKAKEDAQPVSFLFRKLKPLSEFHGAILDKNYYYLYNSRGKVVFFFFSDFFFLRNSCLTSTDAAVSYQNVAFLQDLKKKKKQKSEKWVRPSLGNFCQD